MSEEITTVPLWTCFPTSRLSPLLLYCIQGKEIYLLAVPTRGFYLIKITCRLSFISAVRFFVGKKMGSSRMEEGRGGPKVIRSIDRAARLQRVLSNLVDFCVCVSLLLFFHSFVVVNGYMWESRKEDKCLPIKRQPLWTDAIQLMANNQSGSNLCSWLSIDSIPTNQRDKDYVQLQFANAYNQRGLRMALMLDEYFLTSISWRVLLAVVNCWALCRLALLIMSRWNEIDMHLRLIRRFQLTRGTSKKDQAK